MHITGILFGSFVLSNNCVIDYAVFGHIYLETLAVVKIKNKSFSVFVRHELY